MLGWPVMQRILSTFFDALAVQTSQSRMTSSQSRNEVAGRDLGWFFDRCIAARTSFDYAVSIA